MNKSLCMKCNFTITPKTRAPCNTCKHVESTNIKDNFIIGLHQEDEYAKKILILYLDKKLSLDQTIAKLVRYYVLELDR